MAIKRSHSTDAPMPALSSAMRRAYPPRTLWRDAWRRFQRHRLTMAGSLVLLTLILSILVGPVVYPRAINEIDFAVKLTRPNRLHPLGTDDLGRDLLARLLYGGGSPSPSAWWRPSSLSLSGSALALWPAITGGPSITY